MPEKVDLIKIFLASPGDVKTERSHVQKVIATINRTIAHSKGITFRVVGSENAYPGYGQDGQTIINQQIGKMDEYDLFILIMKDRFGSPTKSAKSGRIRCASGTVEEFQRARKAHQKTGKPDIWFYSGSMKQDIRKKKDKEQQSKVKAFKTRYINKKCGLFKEYKNPSDFKNQLHEQLTLWLNNYSNKNSRRSNAISKTKTISPSKKKSENKTKVANSSNQTNLTPTKTTKERKSSTNRNKTTAKSNTNNSRSISDSGAWVLLDDNLFDTESVKQDTNKNLVLKIPVINTKQEANLRHLQSNHRYSNRVVSYSYQNDAFTAQVESVEIDSLKGKTSYIITLKPIQQSNSFGIATCNGYSIEEIYELKLRFLLLNEMPENLAKSNNSTVNYILTGDSYSNSYQKSIFSDIRKKWKNKPKMFLIHARLAAVHLLKSKNIVEHILKFKLSLNKNILSIDFSGKMQNFYVSQEQRTVELKGKYIL
ncbi:hypothetical protein NIES267_73870 (plasmid) [Calothrix parasitica NIES-267]|uniref:DUF4062 domain-containing protein n=1 Tax=Calothrix parasitica NIES-267 TaxID=1973488 RepID=A0A1Z4M2Z4_9CYAN|nr:hypothetical protein NIES267_73870 [Calothrix parasitica NIES-267]